ncbi:MAG: cell division protein FtsQ/DivIB [Phocaeicola sp.]
MGKRICTLVCLSFIATYILLAVTIFNAEPVDALCRGLHVVIKDSVSNHFVSSKEIKRLLEQKKISPIGHQMSDISTRTIEEVLKEHPLVEEVACYRTPNQHVGIRITQRMPIMRVIPNSGNSYYIDGKGEIMPLANTAAHVVVATGNITREFATKELFGLASYLQENPLWKAQIAQVHVTANKELELVPQVGEHLIFLGKPKEYKEKFARLKTFYTKGLNEIGWNKYSRISLEFSNQIICTKKEK